MIVNGGRPPVPAANCFTPSPGPVPPARSPAPSSANRGADHERPASSTSTGWPHGPHLMGALHLLGQYECLVRVSQDVLGVQHLREVLQERPPRSDVVGEVSEGKGSVERKGRHKHLETDELVLQVGGFGKRGFACRIHGGGTWP